LRSLYDPRSERDACGIGFVADSGGRSSHEIVRSAIDALCRVRHRGAVAADTKSGDGAGLLLQLPRTMFAEIAGVDPEFIGVAMVFAWPSDSNRHRELVRSACNAEGIDVVGWREVPVDPSALGEASKQSRPAIEQALLLKPVGVDENEAERRCIHARKRAEKECADAGLKVYFPSFSFLTINYKALCVADQLDGFYADLNDERFAAPFAIFHQRFSTNTLPTWERAQPFRMICHNGEINTIEGNVNRMKAREGRLGKINLLEEELLRPVIDESGSDSAKLDNVLELLTREGRDVRHALSMLIPAAWEGIPDLDESVRDYYRYHSCLMEPWDGPAAVIFTDGRRVGAILDRNGLRPMRYAVCSDGFVACSSEAGAVDLSEHGPARLMKLGPGRMICVDPADGLDEDPVAKLAQRRTYGAWVSEYLKPASLGQPSPAVPADLLQRQVAFGFTKEEFTTVIRPMATLGHEPTSSMGDDTAPAVLAERPRMLYNYFKQRFAQVTNPPIDHLRERAVMSLRSLIGPHDPALWERPEAAAMLELETFFLFKPLGGYLIDATFPVSEGAKGLRRAIDHIADEAEEAARHGSGILLISDAEVSAERAPVPMLMAVGAVHHRLLASGHRTRVSVVVETDEAREVHHFACLLGYGAEAICPRLAMASLADLVHRNRLGEPIPVEEALMRYRSAVEEGVLKVLSKMGISTTDSYRGAQIFDAIGIDQSVIDLCFTGTFSPVGGIGIEEIATDVLRRHLTAYGVPARLDNPGYFKHHTKGEYHATNPDVVDALHAAVENEDWDEYRKFAGLIEERPATEVRDLLELVSAGPAIPIEEVEAIENITRRFSTGAMSHGSIGAEAHETLAIALNMVGGKSNTGEGGEDPARFRNERNCRIKQVASGRFGVTPEYCSFADELQIKMAQGSKPGEGGQLPGHKVTAEIARLRHTQPGVALISPPPHHDIYSIEDLAQLIFDLKQVNPGADVSVKLVSEVGVGTIAAGVTKALADVVHIAGWDGGTGASPLSSIKNAGLPWEIGLSETRLALMQNGLRDRVRIRVDGGMKSGRDVVIAALLGADEFAFGTAILLAEGCIMVRACHRDTCPVGIATQRPELRAKFAGTPQKVAAYLKFVAREVRETLASLGIRTLDEAIGRVDLVKPRRVEGRAATVDLLPLLEEASGPSRFLKSHPIQRPKSSLGDRLFDDAFEAICSGETVNLDYEITNSDRTVGARLGGALAHRFGAERPPGSASIRFSGYAGQSFGAFLTEGVAFHLHGEANDYVGKGMGGGSIAISPREEGSVAETNGKSADSTPFLAGNTVLYGATGGRAYVAGRAGERFCVRNSGALAVVEGTGDHACEYMTGGTVVILGPVGWNVGAGMTGGRAFVWDPDLALPARVNPELVEAHRLDDDQVVELLEILADHAEATGSHRAFWLLENFDIEAANFWYVAPKSDVSKIESAHEASVSSRA
jgi:glutamate synthase (ferredoxin)